MWLKKNVQVRIVLVSVPFFLINAFLLFLDEDSNDDDDDDEETAADEANSSIPIVQNAFSLLNEDD